MKCSFRPYEGDEKYIFISYSHSNSDIVASILEKLNSEGFRIWYDEGIEWGTEWPESIASHLKNCEVFMAFHSRASIVSPNCRQEINYALKMKKGIGILSVYLEEVELSEGLDMQLSPFQSTFPFQYENSDEFFDRLTNTGILQSCRDDAYTKSAHSSNKIVFQGAKKGRETSRNRAGNKRILLGSIISLLAIIGVLLSLYSIIWQKQTKHSVSSGIQVEQDVEDHLLLKLSNVNHQYEVGLENWKRLDYNRAERDIIGARNEMSSNQSQFETDNAKINNSAGCLYLDMGKYEEAYDYLNNAYVSFREEFGENDSITLAVLFSIAQHDYYTGDVDTAKKTIQEIIDNANLDGNKVVANTILHFMAMIYDELGDYESAIETYNKVLSAYNDCIQDGNLTKEMADYVNDPQLSQDQKDEYTTALKWIILTYNNLGEAYIHSGDYDKAKEILENALQMSLENIYIGRKNLITSKLYLNLARVYGFQENLQEALDYVDLAMRIQKNLFDFESVYPGLVEVYEVYGELLSKKGKPDEALTYFTDAKNLAESSYRKNHPVTAEAYNYLGQHYQQEGDDSIAVSLFEDAVEIRRNILGYDHVSTARYLYNLSVLESEMGDKEKAAEAITEAKCICDKIGIEGEIQKMIEAKYIELC